MPSFAITARKTSPLTPVTVDAPSHQEAIQQVVDTAAEGEQIEVLSCVEVVPEEVPPVGGTGTTASRR
jgi:hypothetical protein